MKLKSSYHNAIIVTVVLSMLLAHIGFVSPSAAAEKKSWKQETVLVSRQGAQTVVRPFEGDKILFKNADPQLAIEWGLANARTTVVLAGKYVVSDRIDIPRDDVTLIIDQGAEIALNPDETGHTFIHFRGGGGGWQIVPLIYNRGRNNVRVINFGRLVWFCRGRKTPNRRMSFPIVFDGRNEKLTCGVEGGLLLDTGSPDQGCWLIDSRGVDVPLMVQDGGTGAELLVLEGCEDCKLGTFVNLSERDRDPESQPPRDWMENEVPRVKIGFPPEGMTLETVDLNSNNRGIKVERLIAERPDEIIDNNASYATVEEVVSIGKPQKLLKFHGPSSGARFTSRPHPGATALNVNKKTILTDAVGATVQVDVPKLPDALPRFTVKSTVEVTLKDGSKKEYTKEVEIDVRDVGVKPEKKEAVNPPIAKQLEQKVESYKDCKIVFSSDRDGNYEIYTMNHDGSDIKRLTKNPGYDQFPSWSPRRRLAFSSKRNGFDDIYVMNPDGSNKKKLTNGGNFFYPVWSPDGKKISFTSADRGSCKFHVINSDGTGQKQLTDFLCHDMYHCWSPSGKVTFVSIKEGNYEIYSIDPGEGNLERRTNNSLTDSRPSWSRDGRLAFVRGKGVYDIYVRNTDGSEHNLTDNKCYNMSPIWSPDGKKIAYMFKGKDDFELWVMKDDGTDKKKLAGDFEHVSTFAWSPGGRKIAFVGYKSGNSEIYSVGIDGSNLTNLTNNPNVDMFPSWSPFLPSGNKTNERK